MQVPPPPKPKASYEDQMDAQSKLIGLFLGSGLALAAVPVLLPVSEALKPTIVPSDQVSFRRWVVFEIFSLHSGHLIVFFPYVIALRLWWQ